MSRGWRLKGKNRRLSRSDHDKMSVQDLAPSCMAMALMLGCDSEHFDMLRVTFLRKSWNMRPLLWLSLPPCNA